LPIALVAALAMASTAATAYFAYATLLCKDPRHCSDTEMSRYAGFVAAVTCISNLLGILALGPLQSIAAANRHLGLLIWMLCRPMSAVMLLLGVYTKNTYVAISGRLFEGLASDNLLHFTLNSLYAQAPDGSALISYSLALYMMGISVSPFIAGFFNFTVSIFMALGLFVVLVVYLLCVPASQTNLSAAVMPEGQEDSNDAGAVGKLAATLLSPLSPFRTHPKHLLVGLCLFTYNIIQSYIFNALMIHTSVQFAFTGRENGYILTIAHSVAALYICASLYLAQSKSLAAVETRKQDSILALVSLTIQSLSLAGLGFANQPYQIYLITVLLAIGLPTPSYIKGYFVHLYEDDEKVAALAALAVMEMLGSVLGPIVFGGLQSYLASSSIFFVAAGLGGVSLACL
ncbi:hypothetical protein B0I35DRAFT_333669, partial [Stachybotrys elegans]